MGNLAQRLELVEGSSSDMQQQARCDFISMQDTQDMLAGRDQSCPRSTQSSLKTLGSTTEEINEKTWLSIEDCARRDPVSLSRRDKTHGLRLSLYPYDLMLS